jgi:hypothetical protein
VGAVTHDTSGVLVAQGAVITGAATLTAVAGTTPEPQVVLDNLRWASGLRRRVPDDEPANDEYNEEAELFLLMAA